MVEIFTTLWLKSLTYFLFIHSSLAALCLQCCSGSPPLRGAGLLSAAGCGTPLCCGVWGPPSAAGCGGSSLLRGAGAPLRCRVRGLLYVAGLPSPVGCGAPLHSGLQGSSPLWGAGLFYAVGCGALLHCRVRGSHPLKGAGASLRCGVRGSPPLRGAWTPLHCGVRGLPSIVGCGASLRCRVQDSSPLQGAGLSSVAGCGGSSLLLGAGRSGFPWGGARALGAWASAATARGSGLAVQGLQNTGSEVAAHRFSCSAARGISPGQGLNLCTLHGLADSYPRHRQGRP